MNTSIIIQREKNKNSMAQLFNPASKYTVQGTKMRDASFTAGNYNRQVISCLKEEIGNIREGMAKLIRVKSEENQAAFDGRFTKIYEQSVDRVKQRINDKEKSSKLTLNPHQSQKIQDLEQQNRQLKQKLRECQLSQTSQKQKYEQKLNQLQLRNLILEQRVNSLSLSLTVARSRAEPAEKKSKMSPVKKGRIEGLGQITESQLLNPEMRKAQSLPGQISAEILSQNNMRMLADIKKFQERIKMLQFANLQGNRLIESQNNEMTRTGLMKLSSKYRY